MRDFFYLSISVATLVRMKIQGSLQSATLYVTKGGNMLNVMPKFNGHSSFYRANLEITGNWKKC